MRVWMLSFELSGIAGLGGLGEAVRGRALALARRGHEVTVFMPSHGACRGRRDLPFLACGRKLGIWGEPHDYCVSACEEQVERVRVVLFRSAWGQAWVLDHQPIYAYVEEKASLFARAMRSYAAQHPWPDLLEAHDWHSVLAGVAVKQEAERRGYALPLLYSIHLSGSPSFPWHYASESWSGLEDMPHKVWRPHAHYWTSYRAAWDSVGGNVEAFGVLEADLISTVSWSYLREELERKYGSWIEGKSCVAYNVVEPRVEIRGESWWELAAREPGLGELTPGVPMIALARMVWQKGLDVAIRALDYAPSVRLLVSGISVGDEGYEAYLRRLVEERWGRVKLVGRLDPQVKFTLMARSAATVVPSRTEPFGIVAVESLAAGTPVIASAVGGLKEIVSDARQGGAGLLVRPDDPYELGVAMESLAAVMSGRPHESRVPELRGLSAEELRRRSMERARAFSEEAIYDMLMKCYYKAREMAYYRAVTP
ncbi:MAG: glycogen/starch synthase [Acidilobaceae archaeon]|nr:glycogen/starch synthase [Acidilobaceae archaeon]